MNDPELQLKMQELMERLFFAAQHGDAALRVQMMLRLSRVLLPNCAVVLLAAPITGEPGDGKRKTEVAYASTGHRDEMLAMMKELVARFEGRAMDPGSERLQ